MDTDKLVFGIIGGITLLITAVIIFTSFSSTSAKDIQAQELLGNDQHRRGPENAKLVIVEFSDFECPYCAQYNPILTALEAQYPNDLAVVYRNFPLPMHAGALPAARAAEAANIQGKFWEYHDELFANQPNFTQSDLEHYAEVVGLNLDQFKADVASDAVVAKVQEDADYGRKLGISGTPTFYTIYEGKAEQVKLQQYSDLEEKVKSILGGSAQPTDQSAAPTDSPDGQNTSDGPSVNPQVPADMPQNLPINVTLDIINVQRDNVAPSQVAIASVTKDQWASADLGCPKDGQTYAQVETSGYKVMAVANGEIFEYHTDESGENPVFCTSIKQ
jgi:protein-disulfide isomerase